MVRQQGKITVYPCHKSGWRRTNTWTIYFEVDNKIFEWPFLFGYVLFYIEALYAYIFITGFLGIGVVIVITVTKKNQRLGDLAAGTVVVDAKTSMSVDDTVFMNVSNPNYVVMFPEVMRLTDNDINTIKSVSIHLQRFKNYDAGYKVEEKNKASAEY